MRLFTSGRAKVNDMSMLYVVMEYAEENLGEVLTHRALTAAEAREMLDPALSGLAYLHAEGLVHGHLEPYNIFAVDGSLRISSDQLSRTGDYGPPKAGPYDPPELATEGYSPAGDVWSLGVTLVEAMTQRHPVWDPQGTGEPTGAESMPPPFGEIARQCLRRNPRSRSTVAALQDLLRNRTATATVRRPKESRGVPHKLIYALSGVLALILLGIIFGPGLRTHTDGLPVTAAPPVTAKPAIESKADLSKPEPKPGATPAEPKSKKSKKEKPPVVAARTAPSVTPPPAPTPATSAAGSGDVVHQVLPDVLPRARRSIRGRVRVSVKVKVDAAGNVVDAELETQGPSSYFAQAALQASRKWKFGAAKEGDTTRVWTLNYQFLPNDTKVVPAPGR